MLISSFKKNIFFIFWWHWDFYLSCFVFGFLLNYFGGGDGGGNIRHMCF